MARMLHEHHRRLDSRTGVLSVLLAEDHAEFREIIASALAADGARVDAVADGEAALSRLFEDRARPDVVVSDVRMPGKTGIDLLRAMREGGLSIPVVLITGFGSSVERGAVEAFGAAILLEKPFDFDDLRTALRNLPSIARLGSR